MPQHSSAVTLLVVIIILVNVLVRSSRAVPASAG